MMLFGGFLKNSFIDYPGKISSVVFTYGCNLKCPYCHNPDLIKFKPGNSVEISEYSVLSFLEQRKGLIDGVVITGGEPTLQSELAYFAKKVKLLGYSVKMDTNGTRPDILANLIEAGLVDYVAMDIKTLPKSYVPLLSAHDYSEEILKSISVLKKGRIPYEFRTTCAKPFISEEIAKEIACLVKGAPVYAVQKLSKKSGLDQNYMMDPANEMDNEEFDRVADSITPHVAKLIKR